MLVGRAEELGELHGALLRASRGADGSAIFLIGEAGVGKSRLAREALAEAHRLGCVVLSGRAVEASAVTALRPITEALLAHFRNEGAPTSPELEPFRPVLGRLVPEWNDQGVAAEDESLVVLAEGVLRLLRAVGRDRGCVLLLEDLQWADPDTLAVVEYLTENLASESVVCLGTMRSDASAPAVTLARSLAAQRVASMLELRALGVDDTRALARACLATDELPDSIERLVSEHADGLPFLVEELLAGAADTGALVESDGRWVAEEPLEPTVPVTLIESVQARLNTIGPAAPVVIAASVLGRGFDWALLPRITGIDEATVLTSLRAAVEAQLLVVDGARSGGFRFRHALTRDAVAHQLLPIERAALCRRAVDAMVEAHPELPDELCDLAASLAEASGDDRRAALLLIDSGRRSIAQAALASADAAFRRAAALAGDRELAIEASEGLCEALALAGKVDDALAVGREVGEALVASGASTQRSCDLELRLAQVSSASARWDVADEHLAAARVHAAESGLAAQLARADVIAAHVSIGRGDDKTATRLAQSALQVAEQLGLHDVRCEALEVIGRCARTRNLDDARAAFAQAFAIADEHDLVMARIRAQFEQGIVDHLELRSSDRLLAARALAVEAGALAVVAHVDLFLAQWHLRRFQSHEVIIAARRSGDAARRFRLDQLHAIALVVEGAALAQQGRRDDMEARIREFTALGRDDPLVWASAWSICRARLSLLFDNQRQALRELDTAVGYMRQTPKSPLPDWGLWALLRVVHSEDGVAACEEVRSSEVMVHRENRGYLHLADAVLHGRDGRTEDAERAFALGDAALAPTGWYRHHARRLVADSAIDDGWGEPVRWLHEALVVFEDQQQDRLAASCRSLLRRAGAPVPRRRAGSDVPGGLRALGVTTRELEVLSHLAEGRSNKDIAGRLYMSPRTVERHVANLTTKTGVGTRSELVAFAARELSA